MINHSLILLLTTISLIIGGCTITPLAQQPVSSRIIYGDGERYWAMDEDGQNRRVIWNCPARFECGNLSPDWRRAVYLEKGEQGWNVRLREQEKAEGRILIANVPQDKEFGSLWSPNGRDLAVLFYSVIKDERKDNNLYLVNLEIDEVKLLDTGVSITTWSSDSQKIGYHDFTQGPGLYVMDLKTGNKFQVIDELVEDRETWSPDSKKIATAIMDPGSGVISSIFVTDLEMGGLKKIQDPAQYEYAFAGNPVWSPDGSNIAYISDYYDLEENFHFGTLFTHDTELDKETPLVDQVRPFSRIIWSPDSQKIIYEFHQDGNHYVIDIITKQITKILDDEEGYVIAWE